MLLSVREAAALLRVPERQVYRWVSEGEIPFQRIRDQVRLSRTDLLEWATNRRLPVALESFDAGLDPEDRAPSLAEALRRGGVHLDVPAPDRDTAWRAIVACTPMPEGVDREFVCAVLLARERGGATTVGDGIAIPHVRHPVVAPGATATVSVSHLAAPLDLQARDGQPIRTVFLVVSPTVRTHLQTLAHIARALHDPGFRAAVDARAPTDALAIEAARLEGVPATTRLRTFGSGAAD